MHLRTKVGFWISGGWLFVALLYVYFRWTAFCGLEPNEHGDFFAGLFAPLAFLWLVIGFIQQGEELSHQVLNARTQSFTQVLPHFVNELYELSHLILHYSRVKPFAHVQILKRQYEAGDRQIFCRQIIDDFDGTPLNAANTEDVVKLSAETQNFLNLFAELERLSDEAKVDKAILWPVQQGRLGKVRGLLNDYRAKGLIT